MISRTFGLALALQCTRVFLALRLNEDAAMLAMWLAGLIGAWTLVGGGAWLPLGFGLLMTVTMMVGASQVVVDTRVHEGFDPESDLYARQIPGMGSRLQIEIIGTQVVSAS